MKNYSGITYKYLGIQKKRTILTLLGIILSVALITSIGTMVYSLQDKMLRDAIRYNGEYHAVFKDVPGSMADKIMKHVDVETCSVTRSRGFAAIAKVEGQKGSSQEGLPPYRYLDIEDYDDNSYSMLPKITLKEGRLPENSNEIAVDYWVLNYLPGHPRLGDKIKLDIGIREDKESHDQLDDRSWSGNEEFIKKNQREYTLTGLVNPIVSWPGGFVSHGYSKLDDNLDTKSNYNVYVKMNSSIGIHDSIVAIAKDLGLTSVNGSYSQVKFNDQVLRYLGQSADSVLNRGMLLVLLFVVILIMVCTIAVIYNIFHISVLERISQFGILRCTGASPGQIRRIVLKEAAVMSVIGIPTGLALGLLAMKVVMLIIGGLGFGLDSTFDLRVFVSIPVLVISTVLGLITIFAAAFGPARQAARVSPLEAVRNTGNFKKENFSKVKRLRLSKKFLKIEGQIAFKNLRRNRKRFRITVFSMVISIILYIVFGNFIGYIFDIGAVQGDMGTDFRATISGGTGEGFTDEQYNTVKALPGVEAVYKFINTYLTVVAPENIINPALKRLNSGAVSDKEGSNIYLPNNTLMSYGDAGFDQLAANLKAGSASKTELDSENGVILLQTSKFYSDINKTAVIDVTHYKVGDTINILSGDPSDSGKGITKQVKVIGILNKGILGGDFSENAGITMITTEKVYKNIIGDVSYTSMGIKLNKDADRGPVTDYLTKLNEQDPKYQFSDISKLREENGKSSIAISIFLYGFVGVITLIGCLNIINTISTNLILRKRELSMLRAVGMTRGAIKKMVAYEGILYGIVAAFYGGILGVVLSYVLSRLTTIIREFDWTFPWIQLITAIVGTIVVTLISSYIPLRKISRQNIVENIRMEE